MSNIISALLLLFIGIGVAYFYLLVFASLKKRTFYSLECPVHSFAVAIPAHNEESIIGSTVSRLLEQSYPGHLFDIYVVADHCTDKTASHALDAGAICYERNEGTRRTKGAALSWLFERIFHSGKPYDALVIFDADTQVDCSFLRIMEARLQRGDAIIQGCHRILNPHDSWLSALTWAMFIIDNRFQNQGRSNLGWSAKHMGDSVCFRTDIVRQLGWGEGLTEDYEFRHKLLLNGIKIAYEPLAVGYGEAPVTWSAAGTQRARWLKGTSDSSRRYLWLMLKQGLYRHDGALLDGALQALFPSYSTLTVLSIVILVVHLILRAFVSPWVTYAWGVALAALALYPILGLALESAPLRAYVAMGLGPVFILWRTTLGIRARFGKPISWVRTTRRSELSRQEVPE